MRSCEWNSFKFILCIYAYGIWWLSLPPQTNWWSGPPEIHLKRNLTVCEMITVSPMTQAGNLWVDILSWQVYSIASQVTVFAEIKKHWAASGNLLPLFSWNVYFWFIVLYLRVLHHALKSRRGWLSKHFSASVYIFVRFHNICQPRLYSHFWL